MTAAPEPSADVTAQQVAAEIWRYVTLNTAPVDMRRSCDLHAANYGDLGTDRCYISAMDESFYVERIGDDTIDIGSGELQLWLTMDFKVAAVFHETLGAMLKGPLNQEYRVTHGSIRDDEPPAATPLRLIQPNGNASPEVIKMLSGPSG
jgi:hypothetical protein